MKNENTGRVVISTGINLARGSKICIPTFILRIVPFSGAKNYCLYIQIELKNSLILILQDTTKMRTKEFIEILN